MSDTDMQEIADALDEGFTEGSGFSMTELGVDPMTFAEWLMGDLDYTIEDAFITGDTGWVDVTATVRDVYAFSLAFNDEIDAYMETEEYQNMTDEAALKASGELFLAAMDKSTDVAETFMMIDVEKKGRRR